MRKLLLSVLLCAALVMGLLPTAAFPMELGNTPEAVEKAPTSALEEQTVNEELLSEYGEQKNAPKRRMMLRRSMSAAPVTTNRIPAQKISLSPRWLRRSMLRLMVQRSMS